MPAFNINIPDQVPLSLLIQLPANVSENATEDRSILILPFLTWETRMEFWSPGFSLNQSDCSGNFGGEPYKSLEF